MSAESTTKARPTYALALTEVRAVERVSPNFVRITFGGADLDEFGTPGDVFDARIKLIFPPEPHAIPAIDRDSDDWWGSYLAVPEHERGSMRTYSVRELTTTDAGTEVVVDFVLHLEPGLTGPASTWASSAEVGQPLFIVGPRRGIPATEHGGAEFAPGTARSVLLAGDETAAPAIARILEDAPRGLRGTAFIEVPTAADVLRIDAPAGVEVTWLPRAAGGAHGTALMPAVLAHLGDTAASLEVRDIDGDELLWETPEYSGLGEDIAVTDAPADRYFWIAGESGVVTTLRRHLVKDLGVDRSQVAFMGYWRRGVAMRG
ncbi:siderophore-interacting protein [Streptomyces sp. AC495_CC817]|uniref:siderophore-interacting protein n=1 Tax=Streptomyces sp. AC495_CC817 TaxID=2823900 RepID=UPI001C25202C|nr:siderophore-interacting protein [Streptomyces sp. AC495_CC817]